MTARYPCPACGFFTFHESSGSYDICQGCGWEDDGIQLEAPGYAGGANADSLYTYQLAVALPVAPAGLDLFRGFRRDTSWRPLTEREALPDLPATRLDYEDPRIYYWQRPPDAV